MIKILSDGEALDLPSGFKIQIEDSNPAFNELGSQSVSATVPATRRNIRLLDMPHRVDSRTDPNKPERTATVIDGAYQRRGKMNITSAGEAAGITFNIGFDNSTAYAAWQSRKLADLSDLPVRKPREKDGGTPVEWLLEELYAIYKNPDPLASDFAIFPVAVDNPTATVDNTEKTYWEVLNIPNGPGFRTPTKVKRVLDGTVTEVTVPDGYCISPFLKVWRVLELVFRDLGLRVVGNPFRQNRDLARLVVLNNAADAVCPERIKYRDLMPDCTVEEFMNALWVRFGLIYNIDAARGTVRLGLLRDILNDKSAPNVLDGYAAGSPLVNYEQPQYIRLSAKTSIEGAAPSCERFEDFARGLDVESVRMGGNVKNWKNTGSSSKPRWDGDVNADYYDPWYDYDPEQDYPDFEPDDHYDDDPYYVPARPAAAAAAENTGEAEQSRTDTFLAREFVNGTWFLLDSHNSEVKQSSSTFFNWDPQPEGVEALDLASDDECVPVGRVSNVDTGAGPSFNDVCPLYLTGARHYHSYIIGDDGDGDDGSSTPLAFMFAYTKDGKTFGRFSPEGDDGMPLTLDDGTTPAVSLLFQFKDGLFSRFWARYDEILRHGNRTVELDVGMTKPELLSLDMFSVYNFRGLRCMIDTLTYTLPAGRRVPVELKLKSLHPQGYYDIKAEQGIPDFSAGSRHLAWRLLGENYGRNLDTLEARKAAAVAFIERTGYKEYGYEENRWYIGAAGCLLMNMGKSQLTWENDPTLTAPHDIYSKQTRTYKAILTYDIYEINDRSRQDGPADWSLAPTPIGRQSVSVDYTVVIAAKWVAD